METTRPTETLLLRTPQDVLRRLETAIRELDRLDAGLGSSRPGHSIRDCAHDLRVLRDDVRNLYGDEGR